MKSSKRVKYLKKDLGRYYYQRRVPNDLQDILGQIMWQKPCGEVDYAKAVQLIVTWAEEDDKFILEMKSPEYRQQFKTQIRRDTQAAFDRILKADGATKYMKPKLTANRPWSPKKTYLTFGDCLWIPLRNWKLNT